MMTAAIIVGTIISVILLGLYISYRKDKKEMASWEIGDQIILYSSSKEYKELENAGRKYAILLGWTITHVFLDLGDNACTKCEHKIVGRNKSAHWRKNFDEAKGFMNKEPKFSRNLQGENSISLSSQKNDFLDGKVLELLNETECEVYLKKAIDEENYQMAEKIRRRMEKFR